MIPMLFDATAVLPDRYNSVRTLPSHYVLSDVISAVVSEELGGKYELTMTYAGKGAFADKLMIGSVIAVTPNQWRAEDTGDQGIWQLDYFRIYHIAIDQKCVMTLNCEHISYILNDRKMNAITTSSIATAVNSINVSQGTQVPRIYATSTQATKSGSVSATTSTPIRQFVGSCASAFGLIPEWVHYELRLLTTRARHTTPWLIKYGVNMSGFKYDLQKENGVVTSTVTVTPVSEETEVPITIGDPALVIIPMFDIMQESLVTAYEWDVLLGRYKKLTIGAVKQNLADVLHKIGE